MSRPDSSDSRSPWRSVLRESDRAIADAVAELLSDRPSPGATGHWTEESLCAQTDPELFFPRKGESPRLAKEICRSCPVIEECLAYALDHDIEFGVWGGTGRRERRALRSVRQQRHLAG